MMANSRLKTSLRMSRSGIVSEGPALAARFAIDCHRARRIATALWLMIAAGTNMAAGAARAAAAP
jgi:hypothetical protein